MMRRSALALQAAAKKSNTGRTVVRDPRKTKQRLEQQQNQLTKAVATNQGGDLEPQSNSRNMTPPIPFQPMSGNNQQPQTVGSTLSTYMLLGAGVTMGITLIRLIIG